MDFIRIEILYIFPKVIKLTFFPRISTLEVWDTKYFIIKDFR